MKDSIDETDQNEFLELYEESFKSIQEGNVVEGKIIQIDKEFVLVDIGYKSEGQIRVSEFIDPDGRLTAKVGDKIDVYLVSKENKEGRIILSKEKAARAKVSDKVEEAYKKHETIRGQIVSQVKGGLFVDIGLQAFLPGSLADIRPIKDLGRLVGKEYDFRIIKFEKRQKNIVLSRRAALEAERKALREKTLKHLKEGATLAGLVSNITDYGMFVDIGGFDGLVHITDISWDKVGHPSEFYQIGDEINVKVLHIDNGKNRISLGIKQLLPDPWSNIENKFPIGSRITGRIVGLQKYGAFIEVDEGIKGLIHISEMSGTEKIDHPSQLVSIDDVVEAVVIRLSAAKRQISLSIKQLHGNQGSNKINKHSPDDVMEGNI